MSLLCASVFRPPPQTARMIQTIFVNMQDRPCPKALVRTEVVLLLQIGIEPLIICGLWMLPYY